eukprot:scaffold72574_cov22-Tisochrysis_lutea.AAC.2
MKAVEQPRTGSLVSPTLATNMKPPEATKKLPAPQMNYLMMSYSEATQKCWQLDIPDLIHAL